MNLLSKSNIFAEDKLFATLDTTVRKVIIDNLPFLLTDTVGFIRKLPHHLIESFKSTLDEVREADLLIHVVDVSHPNFEEQIQVVNQTLKEITNEEKPMILVFNKIDAYNHKAKDPDDLTPKKPENISLEEIEKTWMAKIHEDCVFISATKKQNIEELKKIMYQKIKAIHVQRYPYNDFLYQDFEMDENETDEVE
jgi:GTP-binding protein HflX